MRSASRWLPSSRRRDEATPEARRVRPLLNLAPCRLLRAGKRRAALGTESPGPLSGPTAVSKTTRPRFPGGARVVVLLGEAPPGFEPGVEDLQSSALPLGHGAVPRSLAGARAGNRARTGDLNLGKVALYQLSYARARKESKHTSGPGGRQPRGPVLARPAAPSRTRALTARKPTASVPPPPARTPGRRSDRDQPRRGTSARPSGTCEPA